MRKEKVGLKPQILEWKCECGKVIRSLYPRQLESLKKQHMLTHEP